jgi:hypothetical protein
MVRAACVAHRERCHAEIFQGRYPLRKDGSNGGIPLQVDATNLARSIVNVEVAGDEFLLRLEFERAGIAAHELRQRELIGCRGNRRGSKMLLYVALRAKESLFFAGPQGDANGAARLDVKRLQNAHRFHGNDGAGAVVGGSGAGDPAVEMAAQHHDLVFQLRVGAGNLSDGIKSVLVLAGEFGFDIDLDTDGGMGLREPVKAAIALDGRNDDGDFDTMIREIGRAAERSAIVVKEGSSGAAAVGSVAAGLDDRCHFLVGEELRDLVDQARSRSWRTRMRACISGERPLGLAFTVNSARSSSSFSV